MYQKYLDPVIEEFTTGEYYSEVYQAKQDFFEKALQELKEKGLLA